MRASLACVETSFFEALRLDFKVANPNSAAGETARLRVAGDSISVQPSEIPWVQSILAGALEPQIS